MEHVIYEDKPHTDTWMKLILALPVIIVIGSAIPLIVLGRREEINQAFTVLGACLLLVLLIDFLVVPRAYVVCDSRITIRFRGPLAFHIPFSTVKGLRRASYLSFGISLPTSMSPSNIIEITRKRRMSVIITPGDRQSFITNFENAFKEWQQYGAK